MRANATNGALKTGFRCDESADGVKDEGRAGCATRSGDMELPECCLASDIIVSFPCASEVIRPPVRTVCRNTNVRFGGYQQMFIGRRYAGMPDR